MAAKKGVTYLIVGGGGFVGRTIAEDLAARGETKIFLFDLNKTWETTFATWIQGSITNKTQINDACKGVDVVIHTVAPNPLSKNAKMFYDVNVTGTQNIIDACVANKVKALVFTSSASVIFDGKDIVKGNETAAYSKIADPYVSTKIQAEKLVLKANGQGGLQTCSIRPSAIFGPRDNTGWPEMIKVAKTSSSKYQIGNGKNVVDWTYVGNVSYAHILAADSLLDANSPAAGNAYFITNDEPRPFWEVLGYVYENFGGKRPYIAIPFVVALYIALIVEFLIRLLAPIKQINSNFTWIKIANGGANRTFDISKAKKDLKYAPKTNMDEALAKTKEYFLADEKAKAQKKSS